MVESRFNLALVGTPSSEHALRLIAELDLWRHGRPRPDKKCLLRFT